MAVKAVKKPVAPCYLAASIPASTLPFDNIGDLRSALKRVATFSLVGTKNRPLLATEVTASEIERFNAASDKWIDDGKDPVEFTDSPKIWSDGIDRMWLPTVTTDVERLLASLVDMENGNKGSEVLSGFNLSVNGYTVSCLHILRAVAGDKRSKLTLKGIVAACK
jgi:hypothetical protein